MFYGVYFCFIMCFLINKNKEKCLLFPKNMHIIHLAENVILGKNVSTRTYSVKHAYFAWTARDNSINFFARIVCRRTSYAHSAMRRTVATCCLHVHLRRKYGKVATNGLDVYTKWNIVKQYNTILCTIASGLGREKQSCGG